MRGASPEVRTSRREACPVSRAWRGAGGLHLVPSPSWAEPWAVWVELGGPTGGQNHITVCPRWLSLCLDTPSAWPARAAFCLCSEATSLEGPAHPLHSLFLLPWLFWGPFPGPVLSWLTAQVQVPKSDVSSFIKISIRMAPSLPPHPLFSRRWHET